MDYDSTCLESADGGNPKNPTDLHSHETPPRPSGPLRGTSRGPDVPAVPWVRSEGPGAVWVDRATWQDESVGINQIHRDRQGNPL